MHRTATGATVYLQEELSTARLHTENIKHLIVKAYDLINASENRDHFFAVAGDIIYSLPREVESLERALNSSAMAVNKIDYEEIRQVLRPEKIDELERILEDVRLKIPRRTGRLPIEDIDD